MTTSDFSDILLGTRFSQKMRDALRLVLVDGKNQTDAAKSSGISRQQVNAAIRSLRNARKL